MEDIVVTKEEVTKLLKRLNPSKALGPDELHPRVLKELVTELGPIFTHLFQQSIDSGDIPKEWTLANISPLFKSGDRSLACNDRPVSLTCVPCKLLEHIVCSNIMAHLDELVSCILYQVIQPILGSTPACHMARGEFATAWTHYTPRPPYGKKTPKKLRGLM